MDLFFAEGMVKNVLKVNFSGQSPCRLTFRNVRRLANSLLVTHYFLRKISLSL